MSASIVALKTAPQQARAARITRRQQKAAQNQALVAASIGAVALILIGLSLDHLATGIGLVTGSQGWQQWAMAIGIDLGFVALKMSTLVGTEQLRRKIAGYVNPSILGTIAGSAMLNAMAFAWQANGIVMQVAAGTIGGSIPVLIFSLTKIGATMWIDLRK